MQKIEDTKKNSCQTRQVTKNEYDERE